MEWSCEQKRTVASVYEKEKGQHFHSKEKKN
jgi:hypothetical protein